MADPPLQKAAIPERMPLNVEDPVQECGWWEAKNWLSLQWVKNWQLTGSSSSGDARRPQVEATGGRHKAQGSRLPKSKQTN